LSQPFNKSIRDGISDSLLKAAYAIMNPIKEDVKQDEKEENIPSSDSPKEKIKIGGKSKVDVNPSIKVSNSAEQCFEQLKESIERAQKKAGIVFKSNK
jgi:hypothetical protein